MTFIASEAVVLVEDAGVRLIEIDEDDRVVALARLAEQDAEGCVESGDR